MLHLLGRKDLKKGLEIFLCLIVLLLSITGCSPGTNDTKETDKSQRDSTANTLSDIKAKLDKADTYGLAVSPDNGHVAYIQGNSELLEGRLYLWQVGSSDPTPIQEVNDRICELLWSPNSQYLFMGLPLYAVASSSVLRKARQSENSDTPAGHAGHRIRNG